MIINFLIIIQGKNMAITVNEAFKEFMVHTVNLDNTETQTARKSRDNLLSNIKAFDRDSDFFSIYSSMCLSFGSFKRCTKLRPLDDIDIMICIAAGDERRYLYEGNGLYYIYADQNDKNNGLNINNTNYLNSTKVINRFISKLSCLNDYSKAELHKNQEAATLKLKSYNWNFDIVPCFYCDYDFYLIPNGKGFWKKTDPRIDNDRMTTINQKHGGNLLALIRLVKYWNKRSKTYTIESYLLECMILDIYEKREVYSRWGLDLEFIYTLDSLSSTVLNNVNDPKGIQGNLNSLSNAERLSVRSALIDASNNANKALKLEQTDQKAAIKKWGEVLGSKFPDYTGA